MPRILHETNSKENQQENEFKLTFTGGTIKGRLASKTAIHVCQSVELLLISVRVVVNII